MKRIMLAVFVGLTVCAISAQAADHPVLDSCINTAKRVVKFPVALVATTANNVSQLIWNNPVNEAWELSK